MGLAMECGTLLRNFISQYIKRVAMTSSHSIVAPRYPAVGCEEQVSNAKCTRLLAGTQTILIDLPPLLNNF
jgi:hypothetical protein